MGMLDREYDEKRNFIRMQVNTPVKVSLANEQSSYNGICRDLSGGGMLLAMDQEVLLNTELTVSVISEHEDGAVLEANCSVARVEPGPNSSYMVGLEIQEILNQPQDEVLGEAQ
ncbi:MAG: PilZ domain-containing protein [Pseudomonadota bacterium]